ncbi:constitutive coactivator of PPAR-gamma-like protein 1 isoform X2 [Lethenteron reissneri]|uniref:constitutive coactivator of PPAR-gamma-like protein 1 isoform X2 n=1 Tax=Lethenteron reissneri TaxID=7753 RepID=UPI002AB63714|nr:constitutive coactivator of PPAR-gamma-like protein 1 isoform X2 [Lethenteron reissneri]
MEWEWLSRHVWYLDSKEKCPYIRLSGLAKGSKRNPAASTLCVDAADSLLDRLYFLHHDQRRQLQQREAEQDWLCGGQWRQLEVNVGAVCATCPLRFVFDGGSGKSCGSPSLLRGRRRWGLLPGSGEERWGLPACAGRAQWLVTAPAGLRDSVRLAAALRGASVSQSVRDHRLAVARECCASRCSAVLAQHGDYLAFGPPRLLSTASLRLAHAGSCPAVAREFRRSLGAILDLGQERVPLFASLIGNHILSAEALAAFHKHLVPTAFSNEKPLPRDVVLAVAAFVRSLPDLSDLQAIAKRVFQDHSKRAQQLHLLCASLRYYDAGRAAFHNDGGGARSGEWAPPGDGAAAAAGQPVERLAPAELVQEVEWLHRRGEIHPFLLHVVGMGEVWLPAEVTEEGEGGPGGLPSAASLYRTARQHVYAVLLHYHVSGQPGEPGQPGQHAGCAARIREWRPNGCPRPWDLVPPLALPAAGARRPCPPPLELWATQGPEGDAGRLGAFLACLRCDGTPGLRNQASVPHYFLLLCCVLRYMLQWPGPGELLSRSELNAFLAQAVTLHHRSLAELRDLEVQQVSARGVALARLFMCGVEMALVANDACGRPVALACAAPWNYFDGKLFQRKLADSAMQPLLELCDGKDELAAHAGEMRKCIADGLTLPLPLLSRPPATDREGVCASATLGLPAVDRETIVLPAGASWTLQPKRGAGRAREDGRAVLRRGGGRLKVAGVTVATWSGGPRVGRQEERAFPAVALASSPLPRPPPPPPPPTADTALVGPFAAQRPTARRGCRGTIGRIAVMGEPLAQRRPRGLLLARGSPSTSPPPPLH